MKVKRKILIKRKMRSNYWKETQLSYFKKLIPEQNYQSPFLGRRRTKFHTIKNMKILMRVKMKILMMKEKILMMKVKVKGEMGSNYFSKMKMVFQLMK